jgi:hypothetical protein
MCLLVVEIVMLVGGVYALVTGKLTLTKNNRLVGWRAKIAGLILMSPLPLAFLFGTVLGLLAYAEILPEDSIQISSVIEIVLVIAALVGSVAFAWFTKPSDPASMIDES